MKAYIQILYSKPLIGIAFLYLRDTFRYNLSFFDPYSISRPYILSRYPSFQYKVSSRI